MNLKIMIDDRKKIGIAKWDTGLLHVKKLITFFHRSQQNDPTLYCFTINVCVCFKILYCICSCLKWGERALFENLQPFLFVIQIIIL